MIENLKDLRRRELRKSSRREKKLKTLSKPKFYINSKKLRLERKQLRRPLVKRLSKKD